MLYLMIIILTAVFSYFGPWWVFAPIITLLCYFRASSAKQAMLVSTAAVLSLWGAITVFFQFGEVDLIPKIAGVFTGKVGGLGPVANNLLIYAIMFFIGGSMASLAALIGFNLKSVLKKS